MYKGTAPLFITCKLCDLEKLQYWAQINPATGSPWDTDASMIMRRVKVYPFTHRMPQPPAQFRWCGSCFVRFIKAQAAAWAAQQG